MHVARLLKRLASRSRASSAILPAYCDKAFGGIAHMTETAAGFISRRPLDFRGKRQAGVAAAKSSSRRRYRHRRSSPEGHG